MGSERKFDKHTDTLTEAANGSRVTMGISRIKLRCYVQGECLEDFWTASTAQCYN